MSDNIFANNIFATARGERGARARGSSSRTKAQETPRGTVTISREEEDIRLPGPHSVEEGYETTSAVGESFVILGRGKNRGVLGTVKWFNAKNG